MARSSPRTRLVVNSCLVLALAGAGCQASPATDKTGSEVIVLRLASVDVLNTNGQSPGPGVFVHELTAVSGGRIKATIKLKFEDANPTAESDLVKAIGAGELDGGWPGTRAFANAGIHGLEPLEAPLTLTSYAAQRAAVTGPTGPALLHVLDHTPVVGLGLMVGPLRRPWATRAALVSPQDWRGAPFRVFNSPTQAAAVEALGGLPVNASYDFPDLIQQGKLRGVETDIAQYALNGYGTLAPMVTRNEVLWPKLTMLTISRSWYDRLTSDERTWVQQAAAKAVQASLDFAYDETTPARALCELGVHFIDASPAQLAAMRLAVAPVIARLNADPGTSAITAMLQTVAAAHPDPDLPDVPATCRQP
jgi:TRAP-type C4-dicarboxylate transport system substrate-binding protein